MGANANSRREEDGVVTFGHEQFQSNSEQARCTGTGVFAAAWKIVIV